MDIVGLSYAEFADIREMVNHKRHKLWWELVGRSNKKNGTLVAAQRDMYDEREGDEPIVRCNRILDCIQRAEDELQDSLTAPA